MTEHEPRRVAAEAGCTGMSGILEFLREQIAEDRRVACFAGDPFNEGGPLAWEAHDGEVKTPEYQNRQGISVRRWITKPYPDDLHSASAAHIARWDPARVLAECDAKDRILAEHEPTRKRVVRIGYEMRDQPVYETVCPTCVWIGEDSTVGHYRESREWPCDTVRILALPYSDRPGYREEWAP